MPPRRRNLKAVNGKSSARLTVAQTIARGDEIFRLVAKGYTVTEAGAALDPPMKQQQASDAFNAALERVAQADTSLRQAMLERELETLRLLKKEWMPRALNGDDKAAGIVLKVIDRVANLAGLNQSLKIQISNQRVDATVTELVALLEGDTTDQVPKLLESGVLVIDAPIVVDDDDDQEPDEDETAAG